MMFNPIWILLISLYDPKIMQIMRIMQHPREAARALPAAGSRMITPAAVSRSARKPAESAEDGQLRTGSALGRRGGQQQRLFPPPRRPTPSPARSTCSTCSGGSIPRMVRFSNRLKPRAERAKRAAMTGFRPAGTARCMLCMLSMLLRSIWDLSISYMGWNSMQSMQSMQPGAPTRRKPHTPARSTCSGREDSRTASNP